MMKSTPGSKKNGYIIDGPDLEHPYIRQIRTYARKLAMIPFQSRVVYQVRGIRSCGLLKRRIDGM